MTFVDDYGDISASSSPAVAVALNGHFLPDVLPSHTFALSGSLQLTLQYKNVLTNCFSVGVARMYRNGLTIKLMSIQPPKVLWIFMFSKRLWQMAYLSIYIERE